VLQTTFTITGELSEEGLLQARASIDDLLAKHGFSRSKGNPEEIATRKALALRERVGDVTWKFVRTISRCYQPEQEFTFETLVHTFSVDIESIRSWHRNMSRATKRIDEEIGVEPRFLESRWEDNRQHYWLTHIMREALIAADEG
jgi:hypothetical protein